MEKNRNPLVAEAKWQTQTLFPKIQIVSLSHNS